MALGDTGWAEAIAAGQALDSDGAIEAVRDALAQAPAGNAA
jgi:hypothetical protein